MLYFGKVICHVGGASGSGKTTLARNSSRIFPNVTFKDLDDFDDQAVRILGWEAVPKKDFTDQMLQSLAEKRQELMDDFIMRSSNKIVFVGHHTEGKHILRIPTRNRFLLDTDAKTSAYRAYLRSQKEESKFRRDLSELQQDEEEAQEEINKLISFNYKTISVDDFTKWLEGK